MPGSVLHVRGLTKTYPGAVPRTVFEGASLELRPGDYVAVTGESGSGKSTFLNLVAGLDRADAGTVEIDGVALGTLDDDALTRLRGARMGFVFQAFHVLPYLDVARNVGLPLALLGFERDAARERVAAMLDAVGLADRAASMPRELSGGEMQRVAIARALVHGPRLVLADEPTGNLDPDTAAGILELLRGQIKSQNAAGIIVTHSQLAAESADRVLQLGRSGLHEVAVPRGLAGRAVES